MRDAVSRAVGHRAIWEAKPVLREVYTHLYRRIVDLCVPGIVVEVGGGSGNLKRFMRDAVSFDIVHAPGLDLVADAQRLPFATGSIGNLVMFDVLHHIEFPVRFLGEAIRVLQPSGRIIMVEPAITPISRPFYTLLHDEPVVMSSDPLQDGDPDPTKDPYSGNQAIPTLLATRYASAFQERFPALTIERREWLSLFCYPLSGGFKSWSLLTPPLARLLLQIEDALAPVLGRLMGFRMLLVLQKGPQSAP